LYSLRGLTDADPKHYSAIPKPRASTPMEVVEKQKRYPVRRRKGPLINPGKDKSSRGAADGRGNVSDRH